MPEPEDERQSKEQDLFTWDDRDKSDIDELDTQPKQKKRYLRA
jgi:hypothetical protein